MIMIFNRILVRCPGSAEHRAAAEVGQARAKGRQRQRRAHRRVVEEQVEELGIFMAKNRDAFARAFKNQPDALNELFEENAADE